MAVLADGVEVEGELDEIAETVAVWVIGPAAVAVGDVVAAGPLVEGEVGGLAEDGADDFAIGEARDAGVFEGVEGVEDVLCEDRLDGPVGVEAVAEEEGVGVAGGAFAFFDAETAGDPAGCDDEVAGDGVDVGVAGASGGGGLVDAEIEGVEGGGDAGGFDWVVGVGVVFAGGAAEVGDPADDEGDGGVAGADVLDDGFDVGGDGVDPRVGGFAVVEVFVFGADVIAAEPDDDASGFGAELGVESG